MSKVIIGIHGLGNKPPKSLLEKWWKASIDEGLQKTGAKSFNYHFELVYWADILHKEPLDENVSDQKNPLYLKEKYVPGNKDFIPENHSMRKKIIDFLSEEVDSLFLNKDFTLNYSFITNTILKRWFADLDIYYKEKDERVENSAAKEMIRKRVAEMILKYRKDEILVIGHSMGSIIAYDVMAFDLKKLEVDTFITIGSALGLPIVKSKIAAERLLNHINTRHLSSPSIVSRRWYNFSDLEDKVALNYKLSDDYSINRHLVKPIDYIVNNDYEINGQPNPHKSFGYLRTPEVSAKIIEFLEYRKLPRWKHKLKKTFKNLK